VDAVRVVGVAGLLAGTFSMTAGELVSVRAHGELVRHEIDAERGELAERPEREQRELAGMYRARGVPVADAETVARILMANPEVALDTHSRLEPGVNPDNAGSSEQAAIVSFASFSVGAVAPVAPVAAAVLRERLTAELGSIVIGILAVVSLGRPSGRSRAKAFCAPPGVSCLSPPQSPTGRSSAWGSRP
jgi:vacuolar iron transporter family protein